MVPDVVKNKQNNEWEDGRYLMCFPAQKKARSHAEKLRVHSGPRSLQQEMNYTERGVRAQRVKNQHTSSPKQVDSFAHRHFSCVSCGKGTKNSQKTLLPIRQAARSKRVEVSTRLPIIFLGRCPHLETVELIPVDIRAHRRLSTIANVT